MDAADAGRVLALSNQIQTIQQALLLIDEGATITSMTLTRPDPPPPEPEPEVRLPPAAPAEQGEEAEEGSGREEEPAQPDEERPEPEPEEPPTEPQQPSVGEVTISTEGLQHPPQMMQTIRDQEIEMWRTAYAALAELGVTNVAAPPPVRPGPLTAPEAPPASHPAARAASARPTPPSPPPSTRPPPHPRGRK